MRGKGTVVGRIACAWRQPENSDARHVAHFFFFVLCAKYKITRPWNYEPKPRSKRKCQTSLPFFSLFFLFFLDFFSIFL